MSNMSYCRFENTLADLRDCQEAMRNNSNEDVQELTVIEFNSLVRLIDLCGEIYQEFESYPGCIPEN